MISIPGNEYLVPGVMSLVFSGGKSEKLCSSL